MKVYYRDQFPVQKYAGLPDKKSPLHVWDVGTDDHAEAITCVQDNLSTQKVLYTKPILAVIEGGKPNA